MFFRRFFSIYVSPTRVFDDIRESKVGWWQPWLMVSILFVVGGWLLMPAQQAVMQLNPKMTPEMAREDGKRRLLPAPACARDVPDRRLCGRRSFIPGRDHAVEEATFKKYFTLILFTNLIFALGYVITAGILRARGVDNITSPEDLKISFSLRMLAPEASPVVRGLLASVEFFSLWGLALAVLGLKRIFNLRTGQAVACVIPAVADLRDPVGGGRDLLELRRLVSGRVRGGATDVSWPGPLRMSDHGSPAGASPESPRVTPLPAPLLECRGQPQARY
jgi:hypothetical protein